MAGLRGFEMDYAALAEFYRRIDGKLKGRKEARLIVRRSILIQIEEK